MNPDCVILLKRGGQDPEESVILDVAKNRHGITAEAQLEWDGPFSRAQNPH